MTLLDDISPRYYGEDRFRLTLADPDQRLIAFGAVLVAVDYAGALPEGIALPLEFTVTAPSSVHSTRKLYRRFAPNELAFVPHEGGSFLVRIGELYHNKWFGTLALEIAGDRLRGA